MKKVLLIIRDGWGYRKEKKQNAIAEVNPDYTNRLMKTYPNTLLQASGEAVGLPKGYQGNSEVGHMTIGSGRIIFQSLDFLWIGIADILAGHKRGFTQAGIVAGQDVDHAIQKNIGIVNGTHHFMLHVVRPEDTIPPFIRISYLLTIDNE